MKILFTICGRAGSKGIKNKNIRDFMGKPLPLCTLSAIDLFLINNDGIEADIIVNTDSVELASLLTNWKQRKVEHIERKEEHAGDSVGKLDVIRDSYITMINKRNYKYDMIVDCDITSPLRTHLDIENLINTMNTKKYDSVFSVTNARRNPYFNMVKKEGEYYNRVIESQFLSRQEAPEIFDMNASLYVFSPEFLNRGTNIIFDGKCGIIKMKDTGVLDLDYEEDFELMEVIGKYLLEKSKGFNDIYNNI